ncbi:hypothetical protein [Treponema sp. R6D11]
MKLVITIIICSLICFLYYGKKNSYYEKNVSNQKITNAVRNFSNTSTQSSSALAFDKFSEYSNIDKTLRIVAEKWKKTDVNGDGLYNCIDAAVLFYQYYPDKSKVCIELNYNPKEDFNHLFNCVFTDGVWKGVEPQAYAKNHSNYLMWSVWGKRYDNAYNCVATNDYIKYVRK